MQFGRSALLSRKSVNLLLIFLIVILLVISVLVFDYFSDSFNLIFASRKLPEVMIYGSPSVSEGILFG